MDICPYMTSWKDSVNVWERESRNLATFQNSPQALYVVSKRAQVSQKLNVDLSLTGKIYAVRYVELLQKQRCNPFQQPTDKVERDGNPKSGLTHSLTVEAEKRRKGLFWKTSVWNSDSEWLNRLIASIINIHAQTIVYGRSKLLWIWSCKE